MPPYAGQLDTQAAYADVAPTKPELVADTVDMSVTTDNETDDDQSNASNGLEMLMDFNPCAVTQSMQSAVFKVRTCSHCGKGCNKMSGYIKEMKGEEKVYYHKWCGQLKEWKEIHSVGWQNVMSGLLGHFRAIELAEQRRAEAIHAARVEQARRREEERRQKAEEQARIMAAEQEAAAEAARKQASLSYKMGQKIKSMKEALGCRNNKAVQQQRPN